jgi:hypothetical protein
MARSRVIAAVIWRAHRPAVGEAQAQAAYGAGEAAGKGEDAEAKPFWLRAAGFSARVTIRVQARSSQARAAISHQTR